MIIYKGPTTECLYNDRSIILALVQSPYNPCTSPPSPSSLSPSTTSPSLNTFQPTFSSPGILYFGLTTHSHPPSAFASTFASMFGLISALPFASALCFVSAPFGPILDPATTSAPDSGSSSGGERSRVQAEMNSETGLRTQRCLDLVLSKKGPSNHPRWPIWIANQSHYQREIEWRRSRNERRTTSACDSSVNV